jgi:capsular exopolysaccharide synthesis family protein
MGRLYESLKRAEAESRQPGPSIDEFVRTPDSMGGFIAQPLQLESVSTAAMEISAKSYLVALTDPQGLAAEKFRALVARLEHLRKDRELKSFLITSSVVNEGKTLVTGNLAVTLAKHSGCKVLVIEGDLRRPALASFLGLKRLQGLHHWWSSRKENIAHYVYKINGMPLWFLGAGEPCDQPSQILQSTEFSEAFAQLTGPFDWVLVDSTPMLPTVDVNLWCRLVDGMLLVVREGVAPVIAIEQGIASLDSPKLLGVVLNENSDFARKNYYSDDSGKAKKHARKNANGGNSPKVTP